MDREMKAGAFLLILFIALFAGCLQGEKEAQKAEPKTVKEVVGVEVASLELEHAHVLAVSPEGEVFLGLHDGIAVSYDSGKTWREVKVSEEELEDFMAIAIDPEKPNLIYVGGHGHGVWGSDDYGKTWKLLAQGLPTKPDIHALAVDPSNTRVLYTMLSGEEMYESTDGGSTWTRVKTGLDTYAITAIAVDPEDSNRLYVGSIATGVLISEDKGGSWRGPGKGLTNLDVISLVVDNKGILYAGTKGGVFRSEDKGGSWNRVKELEIEAFGLNPANPAFMAAVSKKGELYISEDAGYQWTLIFKAEMEEKEQYPGPVEEEELVLISGPAKNYRPIAWEELGLEIEGNLTDPTNALDGAFDDTTTYTTVRTQGCDSNYAAVYEWQIKKSQEQPVLYYHWDFTQDVDRASIGAYDYAINDWEELYAIIDFAPMKKRGLRIPEEYINAKGEVKLYFEVVTPCSVGVMQLYDVYLSVPE